MKYETSNWGFHFLSSEIFFLTKLKEGKGSLVSKCDELWEMKNKNKNGRGQRLKIFEGKMMWWLFRWKGKSISWGFWCMSEIYKKLWFDNFFCKFLICCLALTSFYACCSTSFDWLPYHRIFPSFRTTPVIFPGTVVISASYPYIRQPWPRFKDYCTFLAHSNIFVIKKRQLSNYGYK